MKDNSKITITVEEYKQFLRNDILLDEITARAKHERYFGKSEVLAILGMPEKEDEDD